MKKLWFYLLSVILVLSSCANLPKDPVRIMGEAQGTYYSIIYYDQQQRDFQMEIDSLLDDFDQSVSLWVPTSILSRVNNNEKDVILDAYFIENFKLSKEVAEETDGVFDFTIGPLVKAWGFGYDGVRKVDSLIIDSLLMLIGHEKVFLKEGQIHKKNAAIKIDFNAIAQGYSVDVVGQFLESRGIQHYLVDIGGEVKGSGRKPDHSLWTVGIEKPAEHMDDARELNAIVELNNLSIATSGSYRKFFEKDGQRYSHMIDPKSGYPAMHKLLSVTIVTDNTALADAYATACMVMGLKKAMAFVNAKPKLEAFFIYADEDGVYQTKATKGFPKQSIAY